MFNHVSLNCLNVAAQEKFYVKRFGFQRSRTFRPGKTNQFVMLRLGSVRLELYPSGAANIDQKGGEQGVGFKHLAFDAPKLEPAIESLRADGIEPVRSRMSVSTSPVVGSFSFATLKGILSNL